MRLVHRRVVVARFDAGDVVAAVLAAHRAFGVEHHAGGHRRLAHGVADVEAFDPRRRAPRGPACSRRASSARVLRGVAGAFAGQRELGVAPRQVEVAGAFAAHAGLDLHLALAGCATAPARSVRDRGCRGRARSRAAAAARRSTARRTRASTSLGSVAAVGLGEEGARAEVAAVAEGQQQHAGRGVLHRAPRARPGPPRGRRRTAAPAGCGSTASGRAGARPPRNRGARWRLPSPCPVRR